MGEESSFTRSARLLNDPNTLELLGLHFELESGVIFGIRTSRIRMVFAASLTAVGVSIFLLNTSREPTRRLISDPPFSKSLVLVSIASIASSILLMQTLLLSEKTLFRILEALGFLAIDLKSFFKDSDWVLVFLTKSSDPLWSIRTRPLN